MIFRLFFFWLILFATETFATNIQTGQDFYQQGNFEQAIHTWEQDITRLPPGSTEHFNTIISLAAAYQKSGNNYTTAYDLLQKALTFSDNNPTRQVLVQSYLGDLLLVMQRSDEAIAIAK